MLDLYEKVIYIVMNIIMMKLKAPAPKRKHGNQTCHQNIAVSCDL